MVYCVRCGAEIGTSDFCSQCGQAVVSQQESAVDPQSPEVIEEIVQIYSETDSATQTQFSEEARLTVDGSKPMPAEENTARSPGFEQQPAMETVSTGQSAGQSTGQFAGQHAGQPTGQPFGTNSQPTPSHHYHNRDLGPACDGRGCTLIMAAGIFLVVIGLYLAIENAMGTFSFLSFALSSSNALAAVAQYPWASVLFSLFADFFMMITGILAVVFAQRIRWALLLIAFAAVSGFLVLIRVVMLLLNFIELQAVLGDSIFQQSVRILLGFINVDYPVMVALDCLMYLLVLAAIVIIIIRSVIARKPYVS